MSLLFRSTFIRFVVTALGVASLQGVAVAAASPNFILFLADDQAWYGTPLVMDPRHPESRSTLVTRMPNLERLARESVAFSQAYAPAPICGPTRASIQTGQTPARLHMTELSNWEQPTRGQRLACPKPVLNLDDEATQTIAEILKQTNPAYRAAHIGKWHCDYDYLDKPWPNGRHGYDVHDGEFGNSGPAYFKGENPKDIAGITQRACAFMAEQVKQDRPFFLQISHYAVHKPARSRPSTLAHYEGIEAPKEILEYAAMAEDMDAGLGEILATLESLGIKDNTYVIYFSDNGQDPDCSTLAPQPVLRGYKLTLWEAGIRVPLLIRGPGIAPGTRCDEPVVGYDFLPTIADFAGGSNRVPATVDGTSLRPLLAGQVDRFKRAEEALFFHYPYYRGQRWAPGSAIIEGNYKLVLLYEDNSTVLYDLMTDLLETKDLSREMPEKTAALRAKLESYLMKVSAALPVPNPNFKNSAVAPARQPAPNERKHAPSS